MMTPLDSGLVFSARGKSTCAADSTVTEVVTMKMISRTRKMSVNGVMLISAKTAPAPCSSACRCLGPLTAICLPPLQGGVDQAAGVDAHHGVDVLDLHIEIVEKDNRDDRHR